MALNQGLQGDERALVALGSLGLLSIALRMDPGRLRRLAVVGTILFAVQTVLLDGLVWTILWGYSSMTSR